MKGGITLEIAQSFDLAGPGHDRSERRTTCPARWNDDTYAALRRTSHPETQSVRDVIAVGMGWCIGVGVFLMLEVVCRAHTP